MDRNPPPILMAPATQYKDDQYVIRCPICQSKCTGVFGRSNLEIWIMCQNSHQFILDDVIVEKETN